MTITFRDAQRTDSGGSPRTVTKPTGTTEGDLLILIVGGSNASQVFIPPEGFTLVNEIMGTSQNIAGYVKTAGGSEPATYDVTFTGLGSITAGLMAVYSDAAQTLITDGDDVQTNASDRQCPAVTTTIANTFLIGASTNGNVGSTPPGGATERWDGGASPRIWCCTLPFVGPGDTGTIDGTGSGASNTITIAIAEQSAALDAPSNLVATAVSMNQINLTWSDTNDDESGFEIERSLTGVGDWALIYTNAADDLTYSDTDLDPGTTYYYRVRAKRD